MEYATNIKQLAYGKLLSIMAQITVINIGTTTRSTLLLITLALSIILYEFWRIIDNGIKSGKTTKVIQVNK